jgi:oligosaccharyl transferase (archaeosortase A-associated)
LNTRNYSTNQFKLTQTRIIVITLAISFVLSLYLRIAIPYSYVFTDEGVKFLTPDSYYHMRIIDNLLRHFPQSITFDPYTAFPTGNTLAWPPFFDWLLTGIIWLIGLGSPSQNIIDTVSAYFPAVLGALVIFPVFFIGKLLFNRWVGLLSAGLIAVLPGQFFSRSTLGYVDHHVMEVLLTTLAMLFLILAIKSVQPDGASLNEGRRGWWKNKKLLLYSSLTGIFLGLFFLTWEGALLIVGLLFIYYVIQFIIDSWKGRSTAYLGITGTVSFLVALVIVILLLPRSGNFKLYLLSLPVATLASVALAILSDFMVKRGIKRIYYPVTLLVLGIAGIIVLRVVSPTLFNSVTAQLWRVVNVHGTATTIQEMRPLFFPAGGFTLSLAWDNFTTSFFLGIIALGLLTYLMFKRGESDNNLLVVWSSFMFIITLTQVRFAYFLAIPVVLLSAYLSWQALLLFKFLKFAEVPKVILEKVKKKKKEKRNKVKSRKLILGIGVALVLLITVLPNGIVTAAIGRQMGYLTIPGYWSDALSWVKENSPEPFNDPDYYYQLYSPPTAGMTYEYPASAYGVMSWWDFGHWITRITHRIPISNPFQQGASYASRYFLANEGTADQIAYQLGIKYVIIDAQTATNNFPVLAAFIGESNIKYYDVFYREENGILTSILCFYPEYYSSTIIHLYQFDGKQVEAQDPTVVTYIEKVTERGERFKQITDLQVFSNYAQAAAYVVKNPTNTRIVGTDPKVSPVPLNALENYELVYQSDDTIDEPSFGIVPAIKIFERS